MDRIQRKKLKEDKFAQEVGAGVSWVDHHKGLVLRYGGIVLAVVVIVGGIYFYVRYQSNAREEALSNALRIDTATVGQAPVAGVANYATQDEKDKARGKALSEVAAKYHGSEEGGIAEMYLASDAADKGDFANAERMYKEIADSAPKGLASMARLALANVYLAEGKTADGEKVLRDLVANPTATVSKEEATLHLAKVLVKTNCSEARKLLEPLRITDRSAISRQAVTTLGETAACSN